MSDTAQHEGDHPMADGQEVIDIEEYGKEGREPPRGRQYRYKIRVDKRSITFNEPTVTGRQILEAADKTPPEKYRLDQKLHGGQTRKIELDDEVDLAEPGVERFMTIPIEQRDGATAAGQVPRCREFDLPAEDETYLNANWPSWETVVEGGGHWLLIHDFPIPDGYDQSTVTLALKIPATYPRTGLDMAWFTPGLSLTSGRRPNNVGSSVTIRGTTYQRWSRHRTGASAWRVGVDDVSTHIAWVEEWLRQEVTRG